MYSTNFDATKVDLREIETLTKWLQGKTGKSVQVAQMIVVTTDSADISAGLDSFRDAMNVKIGKGANGNGHQKRGRKPKDASQQDGVKKEPSRGPSVRSIKVFPSGEMISRIELNKRLKDQTIAAGTQLHSPKLGDIWVHKLGENLILRNQQGEQV